MYKEGDEVSMKLSIIVPVFNGEKYIGDCMKSLTEETCSYCEIIIVNDGSTDSTKEILLTYEKKFNNIKVFNNENSGASYSRNFGISVATGEYIMFVDADDLLSKGWSEKLLPLLNEKYDFIFFNSNINLINISKDKLISSLFNRNNMYLSTPWSKLYKTEILKKNKILFERDLINGEDFIFNLQFLKKIASWKIIKENVYYYRVTPKSLTKNFNPKILKSDLLFCELLKKELKGISTLDYKLIIDYEKFNGLYLILKRIFSNNNLCNSINYVKLIDRKYYNIEYSNLKKIELTKLQKIVIILFKKNNNYLIFLIFKIINIKNKFESKKDILIKI